MASHVLPTSRPAAAPTPSDAAPASGWRRPVGEPLTPGPSFVDSSLESLHVPRAAEPNLMALVVPPPERGATSQSGRLRPTPQRIWRGHVTPHLRQFSHRYAVMLNEPRVLSRKTVFLFATLTGAGKFAAAYGAFLSSQQFRDGHPAIGAVGCCVAAAGTASFLFGATRFSGAVRRIEPAVGTFLKVWSIAGGLALVSAYTCKGLSATHRDHHLLGLAYAGKALNFVGVSMMQVSFPSFIATSQAVYGFILVDRWHRLAAGWALLTVFSNAPQLAPAAADDNFRAQVGTQLYTAICSFWSLFGAGLVLSTALDPLGQEIVAPEELRPSPAQREDGSTSSM